MPRQGPTQRQVLPGQDLRLALPLPVRVGHLRAARGCGRPHDVPARGLHRHLLRGVRELLDGRRRGRGWRTSRAL